MCGLLIERTGMILVGRESKQMTIVCGRAGWKAKSKETRSDSQGTKFIKAAEKGKHAQEFIVVASRKEKVGCQDVVIYDRGEAMGMGRKKTRRKQK